MNSNAQKDPTPPFGDPYDILHLDSNATNAEITKAYRKLALQLHPDKQTGKSDRDKTAMKFDKVQQARNFLLDAEFSEQRRIFDQQRASTRRRQEMNRQREATMTDRRKKMRDELKRKEEINQGALSRHGAQHQEQMMQNLRKEGAKRRQEYSERSHTANDADFSRHLQGRKKRKEDKDSLEARQIRLKWSRKRMSTSPSEESLAKLLNEQFGAVEMVELIGGKGNAALITFVHASTCKPCVEFYRLSEEMRATYVGKRRESQDTGVGAGAGAGVGVINDEVPTVLSTRDRESMQDRIVMQVVEREQLLRAMEEEDNDGSGCGCAGLKTAPTVPPHKVSKSSFPLEFPTSREYQTLSTPLAKLQHMERLVLGDSIDWV